MLKNPVEPCNNIFLSWKCGNDEILCYDCIEKERDQYKKLAELLKGCMCDASYLREDQVESYLKAKEMMV